MKLNTKVVTGSVKLNYVNIKEARSNALSSEPKYSITIIIPKESNTMDKIYEGIYNATKNGLDIWGGKVPDNLITCLKDGDATGRKEYESGLPLPGNGRGYYQEYSKHLIFHRFHYFTIHSLWKTFWFFLFFPHFQPSFQHFLNFTPLLLLKKIRLFVFFHLFTFSQRCAQQEKKSVIPFYYADLRTHFHKSTAPTTKTKLFYFFILF